MSKIDEATSKAEQKNKISKKPLPVTTSKYNNTLQLWSLSILGQTFVKNEFVKSIRKRKWQRCASTEGFISYFFLFFISQDIFHNLIH